MRAIQEFQEHIGHIETLVQKLESARDPALRETGRDLIRSLLELHGAGLERVLEIISTTSGDAGAAIIEALAKDELVSSLLVLHGVHPEDFETRARRGLDKVRPVLRSRGAGIEIIALAGDRIHVKIQGAGSKDLEEAIRGALLETVPDAAEIVIDGAAEKARSPNFVPLASLLGPSMTDAVGANSNRS